MTPLLVVLGQTGLPGPSFWDKALDQVPALAVVCVGGLFVIWLFLRAQRKSSEDVLAANSETRAVVDKFLGYMEDRDTKLKDSHERVAETIERNTLALGRVDGLGEEIRDLRHVCEANHREQMAAHEKARHKIVDLAHAAHLRRAVEDRLRPEIEPSPSPEGG